MPDEPWVPRAAVKVPGINVWEAALERTRWIFQEFNGHVSVSISGGKDSTVVMELGAIVAREWGQKLRVHFLDQEAEWSATRDYLRHLKDTRKDIEFDWYQIPFKLFNSASFGDEWGQMWEADHDDSFYVRPPEHDAIRTNDFFKGTKKNPVQVDRFAEILRAINKREGGAHLTGMRAEEAPTRRLGLTTGASYKWVTWASGKQGDPFVLFHPIYDWSYRDVWAAIEQKGWLYNPLYDAMFQHGTATRAMRVSSLVHEHALAGLGQVQELEPQTWEALVRRFPGINAYGHVGDDILEEFRTKRPYMFDNWEEYLFFLIDKLIPEPENRTKFYKMREEAVRELPWMQLERIAQCLLTFVMKNDHWNTSGYAKWLVANRQWASGSSRDNGNKPLSAYIDWAAEAVKERAALVEVTLPSGDVIHTLPAGYLRTEPWSTSRFGAGLDSGDFVETAPVSEAEEEAA